MTSILITEIYQSTIEHYNPQLVDWTRRKIIMYNEILEPASIEKGSIDVFMADVYRAFYFGDYNKMTSNMKKIKKMITYILENPEMIDVIDGDTTIHNGNDEAFRQCMERFRIFQKEYDIILGVCIKFMVYAKKEYNKLEKKREEAEMRMMLVEDLSTQLMVLESIPTK